MAHPDEPERPLIAAAGMNVSLPASAPGNHVALAALSWFAAALALCLIGYLAMAVPGAWFPAARAIAWDASGIGVARGNAAQDGNEFVVAAPDATGIAIVTLNTDFRASDYAAMAWNAIDVPADADVRMLWRNDYAPSRLNTVPVAVASGRLLPVTLSGNANWIGRISGVALSIRGALPQPLRIRGVTAKPQGAPEILADRVREWLAFEGWTGTSINAVTGGADIQDLPLPALAAAAVILALIARLALAWRSPGWRVGLPQAVAIMFIAAWLIQDGRWTWNLARQVRETARQYAGKSDRERHLAAEDGALYAFIEKARAKLPSTPARVFMVADAHYFRGRGAYHLYPHNVHFDPYQNFVPPASSMKPGDYLVVYQRRGIQYDAKNERLRWEGGEPVVAELVLLEPGAAMFRIR